MHAIILFLIGMISTQIAYSQEKSFEFNSALLTHHFSKLNADKYENKVSKDGRTINNKLYSLTLSESEEGVYSSTNFFIVAFGLVSEISFSCKDSKNRLVNSENSFSDSTLYLWYSLYPFSCKSTCFISRLPERVLHNETFEKILLSLELNRLKIKN